MKRVGFFSLRPVLAIAVLAASVGSLPAHADPGRDESGNGGYSGGYSVTYRDRSYGPRRSYAEIEYDRGYAAGSRAGWSQGFRDGYEGRGHNCNTRIDLRCRSAAFRDGFRRAFDRAYNAGYDAGRDRRERERCGCGGSHGRHEHHHHGRHG